MTLKETLAVLPKKPGVYLMKDEYGEIIYVGKAISLRNRVRSYFQSSKNHSSKVKRLVTKIVSIETIITDTELEALILECNLIKKYRPYYNVRLKDDKNYPYIKVTLYETYPRIFMTRRIVKDGSKYYGPFSDSGAVASTLRLMKKIFPIRQCTGNLDRVKNTRKCLNFHINQCLGPCTGDVDPKVYMEMVNEIILFLEGKRDDLARNVKKKMEKASEDLDFERAAMLRDQLHSLEKVIERQKIISENDVDQDVIAIERDDKNACVQVFFIRGGRLLGKEHFMLDDSSGSDENELVSSFMKQYYSDIDYVPQEILLQSELDEINIVTNWLSSKRGSKVTINSPKKGDKKKLLDMVSENAKTILHQIEMTEKIKREKQDKSLEELRDNLGLNVLPKRIECYDISNIQGVEAVGSMVVFTNGLPDKKEYRKFKVKTVEGPNDFEMMKEVLTRRFLRASGGNMDPKFAKIPDLIIVDGGKGQLSSAKKALDSVGFGHLAIVGLAKENEELFLPEQSNPIILGRSSQGLFLVQRVRDEAHRFAITYHRELRGKRSIKSEIEDIPGIGKKRLLALMKTFKSLDAIKAAELFELEQVGGMTKPVAKQVFEYFHAREDKE